MANALLTDVEARAQRRRTRTRDSMWQDLVRQSWDRAQVAANPAEARQWLDRAHRLLPHDGMIATALATALLQDGALEEAEHLFHAVAERHGTAEAWAGLAAVAHLRGHATEARAALADLLQRSVVTDTARTLAATVAGPGWCGLTLDGRLWAGPGRADEVRIDGHAARLRWTGGSARLPPGWQSAAAVAVEHAGQPLLGSPLPLRRLLAVEGVVEATRAGGIEGWAWHPADPDRPPALTVSGPLGHRTVVPRDPAAVHHDRPMARPRRVALASADLAALGRPLAVRGPDGRHLLGSPLDPGLELRALADPRRTGFAPTWADLVGPPPPASPRVPAAVVVPVFGGRTETLACLASVLAGTGRTARVIVVDDASPDPALAQALDALARRRRITLVRLPTNRGFPGAANAGIAAAAGQDVALLNSDTLVPPGWLDRLQAAAYGAGDIGTVSPLSNDATILSYPGRDGGNPCPDLPGTVAADALAQQANGTATADIPVGVGSCLFIRRACLDAVGPLREDLFAQGYGEENDLCLRARHAGWRNVAALGVFVAHAGAASFGAARAHLVRRNAAILNRLHPGYDALVAQHLADDPLATARRRMDAERWAAGRQRAAALVCITHAGGGGVERVVQHRAAAARAEGRRAILLRPARTAAGTPAVRVEEPGGHHPNLVFPMPSGLGDLVRMLRPDKPARVELHHLLGHAPELAGLAARLGTEAVSVVHDYARFCPRIALVGTARRYCGEPDVAGCEACIADLGSLLEDDPPVRTLLARSAAELAAADTVIAPSADAASRIARHFPGVRPKIEPWEADSASRPVHPGPGPLRRIVVVGAIGVEKGFEILLACVRDAQARALPLQFTVVGFTADDERLMAAGPAFVTGEYIEADATELIRAQRGHLALIPSVWPETWCFALSRAWEAGLPAAVFDLGAQAERVRATGRGAVLPLGLGAPAVNDALLRLAMPQAASQCPPRRR